jgi:hypothetical protein
MLLSSLGDRLLAPLPVVLSLHMSDACGGAGSGADDRGHAGSIEYKGVGGGVIQHVLRTVPGQGQRSL